MCEGPHPYPQRTKRHQKGYEPLEESNQNQNPREAQELKKKGLPLCWKIKKQKWNKKGEKKGEGEGEKPTKEKTPTSDYHIVPTR
jgi:hypothetical protein